MNLQQNYNTYIAHLS